MRKPYPHKRRVIIQHSFPNNKLSTRLRKKQKEIKFNLNSDAGIFPVSAEPLRACEQGDGCEPAQERKGGGCVQHGGVLFSAQPIFSRKIGRPCGIDYDYWQDDNQSNQGVRGRGCFGETAQVASWCNWRVPVITLDDGDGKLTKDEGTDDIDGDGNPNYLDFDDTDGPLMDSDNDGILNGVEGYAFDRDGDGLLNWLDDDDDGDGIPTIVEGTGNPDGDSLPNYLDTDSDGDGKPDSEEGTSDSDNDGRPNYLDADDSDGPDGDEDEDGVVNSQDAFPADSTEWSDNDNDGTGDNADTDDDNDLMPDDWENRFTGLNSLVGDADLDYDGDGLTNYEGYINEYEMSHFSTPPHFDDILQYSLGSPLYLTNGVTTINIGAVYSYQTTTIDLTEKGFSYNEFYSVYNWHLTRDTGEIYGAVFSLDLGDAVFKSTNIDIMPMYIPAYGVFTLYFQINVIVGTNPIIDDTDGDTWLDGDEVNDYYTNPVESDTDHDGVPDDSDIDPLVDLEVTIKITEILQIDDVDSDGDFFVRVFVNDVDQDNYDFSIDNTLDLANANGDGDWINDDHKTSDEIGDQFTYTVDVPDSVEDVSIWIDLFDNDEGISYPDDWCDISGQPTSEGSSHSPSNTDADGRRVVLTYNLKTGQWSGDDSPGDANGYGHVSGNEDGSGDPDTDEDDCEVWFDVWSNTDTDGDGIGDDQDWFGTTEWDEKDELIMMWPDMGTVNYWEDMIIMVKDIISKSLPHINHITLLVKDNVMKNSAIAELNNLPDSDKIRYIIRDLGINQFMRDYGPQFISNHDSEIAVIDWRWLGVASGLEQFPDHYYDEYGSEINAFFPEDDVSLHGGNIQFDGLGYGYTCDILSEADEERIRNLYGLKGIRYVDPLPSDVNSHLDMIAYIASETSVILPNIWRTPDNDDINKCIRAEASFTSWGFDIYKVDTLITDNHVFTYTNALILNDIVLLPQYGDTFHSEDLIRLDSLAYQKYHEVFPNKQIIKIDIPWEVISSEGAIHCLTMTRPFTIGNNGG
ncbi:MAG: agmatine deiminase family protein [Candidatus Peribacteraceae bacterium]|nr:agmatine deiminase family protein [Candidatus Peribacteraceae bacterium]